MIQLLFFVFFLHSSRQHFEIVYLIIITIIIFSENMKLAVSCDSSASREHTAIYINIALYLVLLKQLFELSVFEIMRVSY